MPPLERIAALEPQQETLRLQLQDEPSHAPTTARYPPARGEQHAPPPGASGTLAEASTVPTGAGRREYETLDWYEELLFLIPAGAAFVEAGRFATRPDKIIARTNLSSVEIRLKPRGGAPGDFLRLRVAEPITFPTGAEIIEARDPAGAGGQTIFITGLYNSKQPAVRALGAAPMSATETPAGSA